MITKSFFTASSLSSFLALAACGGIAVVDDAPGTGGSTSSTPSGPTSGPGAGPMTTCAAFCAATANCAGGDDGIGDCPTQCSLLYTGDCVAETDAFLNCLVTYFGPTCELPPNACTAEINAYSICTSGPQPSGCFDEKCSGDDEFCSCRGTCTFGKQPLSASADCKFGECSCTLEGDFVGSCKQPGNECSLSGSCCYNLFFGFE
jgi:hypothetical protein